MGKPNAQKFSAGKIFIIQTFISPCFFYPIMAAVQAEQQQQSFDLSRLYVWLKGLEGKANNLIREVSVLKNDYSKKVLQLKKDIKALNDALLELQHQREGMQQKTDLIIKELKQTAGMEEVAVIKKYIEYWNPLNFVTQRDVERIVELKLQAWQENGKEKKAASPALPEKPETPREKIAHEKITHEKIKKAEHFTG